MRTLLIDDEPFVLKLHARQLANLGHADVITCESAQDAMAILKSAPATIDLIITDLQMPGMDGVEFVRGLAQIGYPGGLVLVSGEDGRVLQTVQRLAQAHNLRVLGAFQKPLQPGQLAAVMQSVAPLLPPRPQPAREYTAADLAAAIEQGQLVNFYQPKVSVSTSEIVGVESLVRWRHPTDGLIYPDRFIHIAEEHNLIDALTRSVLGMALAQSRQWAGQGLNLHVAVNISMDNLSALEFPDFVADSATEAGVAPASLVLEVTESRLMKNMTGPLDILSRLRLKRISLSIDDFGTGHSSLKQLRDIPFDELKIDRGFVHGAGADTGLAAIFEASVSMAKHLGMRVVAEGVEDPADWKFLASTGCDAAQGYYIGKPQPGPDLPNWVEGWRTRGGPE